MQGIDLGSVFSKVLVDTSGMTAGISDARRQLENLGNFTTGLTNATRENTQAISDNARATIQNRDRRREQSQDIKNNEKAIRDLSSAIKEQMNLDVAKNVAKGTQAINAYDQSLKAAEEESHRFATALKEQMQAETVALNLVGKSARERLSINTQLEKSDLALAKIRKGLADDAARPLNTGSKSTSDFTQIYGLHAVAGTMHMIGSSMSRVGDRAIAALSGMVQKGAELNQTLVMIRNNTLMTDKEFAEMSEQTKQLGVETGAAMGQIAMGARHIRDYGFTGKAAMDQLRVATEAAIATQTDAGDTAQLLSRVMRIFSIDESKAAGTMNALWFAAANSNLMMKDLVDNSGRALAMAGPMGITFEETAAAISVFAHQGLNASQAATQLINDIKKLHSPTKQTSDYLDFLAQKAGPDIRAAFTTAGLMTNQLSGSFQLLAEKSRLSGIPLTEMLTHLFPGLRGETGALIGTTASGLAGMNTALGEINDMMAGRSTPLTERYADAQKQLGVQLQMLNNAFTVMASTVAQQIVPILIPMLNFVKNIAIEFGKLSGSTQTAIIAMAAMAAAGMKFVGIGLNLTGTIVQINAGLLAMRGAATAAGIAEAGAAAGAAGISFGALASTLGLVVLAVGAVAGAVYLLTSQFKSSREESLEQNKIEKARADSLKANAERVSALVKEYNKLKNESKGTFDENQRLHDILDEIGARAPGLVSGFDSMGHAISLMGDYAKYAKDQLNDATRAAANLAQQGDRIRAQGVTQQIEGLKAEQQSLQSLIQNKQALRKHYSPVSGMGGTGAPYYLREGGATIGETAVAAQQLRAKNRQLEDAINERRKLQGLPGLPRAEDVYRNLPAIILGTSGLPSVMSGKQLATGEGKSDYSKYQDDEKQRKKDAAEAARSGKHAASEARRYAKEGIRDLKDMRLDMAKASGDKETYSFAQALEEFYEGKKRGHIPLEQLTERLRKVAEKAVADAQKIKVDADKKLAVKIKGQKEKADKEVEDILKGIKDVVGPEFQVWAKNFQTRQEIEDKIFEMINGEDATKRRNIARDFDKNYSKENSGVAQRLKDLQTGELDWQREQALKNFRLPNFSGMMSQGFAMLGASAALQNRGARPDVSQDVKRLSGLRMQVSSDMFDHHMELVSKVYKFEYERDKDAAENFIRMQKQRIEASGDSAEMQNDAMEKAYAKQNQMLAEATKQYADFLRYKLTLNQGNLEETLNIQQEIQRVENEQIKQSTEVHKEKAEKTYNIWRDSANRIKRDFGSIFSSMFEDLLSGHKSFLKTFLDSFKAMLIKIAAELAASSVMHSLSGLFGGGGKKKQSFGLSSITDILSGGLMSGLTGGLGGIIGGLFGGGKKGGKPLDSGIGGILGGITSIFGFAEGGFVPGPSGMAQLATVHGGEFVVSNRMQQQGAMGNVNVHLGGVTIAGDYDVDRMVDRISWAAKQRLAVNPGVS